MALQITENKTNIVPYQSGSGIPSHLSPLGSVYVDNTTGTAYINKDGLTNWAYFYDSTTSITGSTTYVTGGIGISAVTSGNTVEIINILPDKIITLSGDTNISITGDYPNFNIAATGLTDTYTTGFTYSANTIILNQNNGQLPLSVTINTMTGLTTTTLSAATISGGMFYGNGSGLTNLISSQITSALGYIPYNTTNPNNYISNISGITAGGDLIGTYPNPTINMINGITKSYYDPTSSIQNQLNSMLTISSASTIYLPLSGGTLTGDIQQPSIPVNGSSLINKNYVDNIIIGVIWVGADTDSTTNIVLSGEQTINGVTTSNSRVFVHGQTTGSQNGVYISSSGAWTRSSDASTSAQIIKLAILIEGGTNKGQQWVNTNSTIVLDSTNITFGQNFGIIYGAGTGLLLSGTAFTIDPTYTATTSRTGYLSSIDWTTFNNKQAALSGNGLVKSTSGTISYISGSSSQFIKGDGSLDSNTYLTANQTITLSGDVTGTGNTFISTTLATITQSTGNSFVKISLDTKGRVIGNTAVGTSDLTSLLSSTYQPLSTILTSLTTLSNASGVLTNNGSGTLSWTAISSSQWTTSGNDIYYTTGRVSIGTSTASSQLLVYQPTTGLGTVSISSGTVTGTGTQFTNTFKIGDTFTANSVLYTISAISSDTAMTVSPTTNQTNQTYTLTGGSRFNVYGNGNISFGGNTGTIGGPSTKMWWDATNNALNIGSSTQQSSYLLNVNGGTSLNSLLIASGRVTNNVSALTVTSNATTMNCSLSNYFTITLGSSVTTTFTITNIPSSNIGQVITIQVTTGTSSLVSFPSTVKQPAGASYVPTTTASSIDILTFVTLGNGNLYLVSTKNLS